MKFNTPNLNLLLSRLRDAIFSWGTGTLPESTGSLPIQVGDFKYLKDIYVEKGVKFYKYALYENADGKLGFAKAWLGKRKNTAYYWLENGIALLSAYTSTYKNKSPQYREAKFNIPQLYQTYRQADCLMYICENIPEVKEDFSDEELVGLYNNAILFIRDFGTKAEKLLKNNIFTIGPYKILFSIPLVSLKALISRPTLWKEILISVYFSLRHGLNLLKLEWSTLVHRDIRGTILKSGDKYYIIDWQTAAISNSMFELAQLFLTYWENSQLSFDLFKLEVADEIFTSEKTFNCFKIICIYKALIEIGFIRIKSQLDEKTFLREVLSLKRKANRLKKI